MIIILSIENALNSLTAMRKHRGLILSTDVCKEKSNEIKSVSRLLNKIDIWGCIVTVDAMLFRKSIIDKIRQKGGDFVIELKANQRSLRYGLEDKIKTASGRRLHARTVPGAW